MRRERLPEALAAARTAWCRARTRGAAAARAAVAAAPWWARRAAARARRRPEAVAFAAFLAGVSVMVIHWL